MCISSGNLEIEITGHKGQCFVTTDVVSELVKQRNVKFRFNHKLIF